jgi:hypothetical protein
MSQGLRGSARTITVLSDAYLRSNYGSAEWQSAWATDPSGTGRRLLVVRVADCERPGPLAGGAVLAAQQVSKAMDLEMADVAAAVQELASWPPVARFSGEELLGKHVLVGPNMAAKARAVLGADLITLSEGASILPLEDISELSARASQVGIAGFNRIQVFTLVLVWLLAVGIPTAQQELPKEAQILISNENGMISLTLAILSRKH